MAAETTRANFPEFLDRFSSEAACLTYLEGLRWGEQSVCPHCGVVDGRYWRMHDGWRRCAVCRKECSVTSGTILQGTRYPLQTRVVTGYGAWRIAEDYSLRDRTARVARGQTGVALDHLGGGSEQLGDRSRGSSCHHL